jgi:fused signal recognition particle receptor
MSLFDRLFRRSPKPAPTPELNTSPSPPIAPPLSTANPIQTAEPVLWPHTPAELIELTTEPVALTKVITETHSISPHPVDPINAPPIDNSLLTSSTVSLPSAESTSSLGLSWREKLKAGLKKTRTRLASSLSKLLKGRKLDAELLEELETLLLTSDVGVKATQALLDDLQARYKTAGTDADAYPLLQQCLIDMLLPLQAPLETSSHKPFVIMLAGVNGAGKTTSIGKLAHYFQQQGKTVLLAAGDTFRAAAREQLTAWGERNHVAVISQQGSDPAAVIFDAVQAAQARGIDIVLADTAGRLGTQPHLMEELKKIKRVIGKADETAPHEVLLVLDANTGQNALNQLAAFDDAMGITGLILSKLDGSAKGGVIAAIAKTQPRPIRFIGVGEGVDDLRPFEAEAFVQALFDETED